MKRGRTKDTGPVYLPQRAIDPTLPTANCSSENLPQPSIDFELLSANCSAELPPPTSNCPEELQPEDFVPIVTQGKKKPRRIVL